MNPPSGSSATTPTVDTVVKRRSVGENASTDDAHPITYSPLTNAAAGARFHPVAGDTANAPLAPNDPFASTTRANTVRPPSTPSSHATRYLWPSEATAALPVSKPIDPFSTAVAPKPFEAFN